MLIKKTYKFVTIAFSKILKSSSKLLSIIPISCLLIACGGGSGGSSDDTENTNAQAPASLTMNANPKAVKTGQFTTITWEALNSDSCFAKGEWTKDTSTTGAATVKPEHNKNTYTMICHSKGKSISESISISFNDNSTPPADDSTPEPDKRNTPAPNKPNSAPSLSLSADANSVEQNTFTTIRWSSKNAISCKAFGNWTEKRTPSGSQKVGPLKKTTSYMLTCSGAGGSSTKSVRINVLDKKEPSIIIAADPETVNEGKYSTIRWESKNTDLCTSTGGWTNKNSISGTESVGPLSNDTEFSITCEGNGKAITKTVKVTVTPKDSLGSVELSWTPPNTNENGTALTDLAGYTIHYGISKEDLNKKININMPGVSSHVINNLTKNTYYFAVSAFDASGNNSKKSAVARKSIN